MGNFIDRLETEQSELLDKLNKLETFIDTPEFENLDLVQRELLKCQSYAMNSYAMILTQRLDILNNG